MSQGAEGRGTGAGERIVAQVFIAGTPEAVWHEITKTDEAQGCFFNAWLHTSGLAVGGAVAMRDRTGRWTAVVGRIVEYDPPRRLAQTFRFTRYDDAECLVVYDIEPTEGGVLFTLTVDGAPRGSRTEKDMRGGAKMITSSLKRIVEKGDIAPGLRVAFRLMEWLAPLVTPKRCRSEAWPLR